MISQYTLKVVAVNKETEDAVTICFKQPGLKKIKYLPGQYLTLIVQVNNRKYKRPYSLSSSPGIDDTLNVTVKRVLHGVVSNHLIDTIKEGDMLEVMSPMGDFVYNDVDHCEGEIFLWGAGSGITPLISILKAALKHGTQRITLTYCNPVKEQTIFLEELLDLQNSNPEKFHLNLYFTRGKNQGIAGGRINETHISEIVTLAERKSQTFHYVCGPEPLKNLIINSLMKHGITENRVFSEEFEHIINAEQLKDVRTQTVSLDVFNETVSVEVTRGKSILEAGLDLQLDLPYSCQTGSCKLCKGRLVNGNVKTIYNDHASLNLLEDECLLCCSYPLTDDVLIEVI